MRSLKTVFKVKIIRLFRESIAVHEALKGVRKWLKSKGIYRNVQDS